MSYDETKRYVITRNLGVDRWVHVRSNGSHEIIDFPTAMRAGEVAEEVARANPSKQIGFLADTFGPATCSLYGEFVWLKPGYGLDGH